MSDKKSALYMLLGYVMVLLGTVELTGEWRMVLVVFGLLIPGLGLLVGGFLLIGTGPSAQP